MLLIADRWKGAVQNAFRAPSTLPIYRRPRSPFERVTKHGAFLAFCIVLGFFYGLLYTLFPTFMLVYLALPIAILAVVVIWALPDTNKAPVRLLTRLFFVLLIALTLWPNYLAIQIPGLPWFTLRRLVTFPLIAIFIICLSTSSRFRSDLAEVLRSVKPAVYAVVILTVIQLVTIFWSANPFSSLNIAFNYWTFNTALFFIGAAVLRHDKNMTRFLAFVMAATLILSLIGVAEYLNGRVLWADYIPPFLKVDEGILEAYLAANERGGRYRSTAVFSVSLAFAEFLAIVTVFVVHRMMTTQKIAQIAAWGAFDLLILVAINTTGSRLGILGWITAHAVYGCVWAFIRWRNLRTDLLGPATSLGVAALTVFVFIGMFTIPAIRNRTIGGGASGSSDYARQVQFDMMWPRLLENPFGYGSGQSGQVLGYFNPGGQLSVDSSVITYLLDAGVIGFSAYAFFLLFFVVRLLKIAWTKKLEPSLALPMATFVIVVIQIRMVLSQFDNAPLTHIFLGMAAVLIWRYDTDQSRDVSALPNESGWMPKRATQGLA